MKLKMLGLLGALAMAAPVAAIAAPANGLTAQMSAPAIAAATAETDAAVTPGTVAKVDKVWWRGGYGWRGGWRGYGWRGYGWRAYAWPGYGWRGYGWRRRFY